jgi:hypothetical protein
MTYKLVDILTSLKVLKIKNILLYEMEFLERIYSCLPAEPLNRGYRLQVPVLSVLCPQLNLLNTPNKIPGHATDENYFIKTL